MDGRAGQVLSCKTGLQTLVSCTPSKLRKYTYGGKYVNVFASVGVFHLLTLHGNLRRVNIIFDYA